VITPEAVKSCCAALYESDWVPALVGDPAHPGGLELTERLGTLLGLDPGTRLLDAAAGRGASSRYLAQRFGCQVVGVDLSFPSVLAARSAALAARLDGQACFLPADAEQLPFPDGDFDAAICECAFCTFPDKPAAAAELHRVLRPGGRFGLADLVRNGPLPSELNGLLAWAACVGDARPVAEYTALLEAAGLHVKQVEIHDRALEELIDSVRLKLSLAGVLQREGTLQLPEASIHEACRLANAAASAVRSGRLGYVLVVAERPRRG